jgi:uncharacterized protein
LKLLEKTIDVSIIREEYNTQKISMIANKTKKKTVAKNFILCNTLWSKFMGLMFSGDNRQFMVFKFNDEKKISLHMMFVFYPIDVVFLDSKKKVVDTKENFKPFSLYASKKPAKYCIECPKGTIGKTKTKVGDDFIF